MPATAIVGANWGDEGKGKITDCLAKNSDYVVRFQGGNNAGHTVINHYGKSALHLLPSGIFYQNVTNILGPGVALNPEAFLKELADLKEKKIPRPRVLISERAQIVLPYHILFDELEEARLKKNSFGSTKKGIAPFYSDKHLKIGLQINEIFDTPRLKKRLEQALSQKNVLIKNLYRHQPVQVAKIIQHLNQYKDQLKPFVKDTTALLQKALLDKKQILLEGQLGALRDIDHGIYPFTTSSSPLAGFASVGAGLPPYAINKIIAVTKAYSSCVGAGPFVTELSGSAAQELRDRGGDAGEYGATTGRPRRVGWFDCIATRHGIAVQGATHVAMTNLDVLGYLPKIKVCIGYQVGKKKTDQFPITRLLDKAKPVYQELPGWKTEISQIKSYQKLPANAKKYLSFIEKKINAPIKYISVGPKREQLITR